MKTYQAMLDELYKNLPPKISSGERFAPPEFDVFLQGNQTIIRNFSAVAEKLRRDGLHLLKFLSKEMGVPGNIDSKRAIFQAKFRQDQLNLRLTAYITEYVLCNECKKPDTSIITFEAHKYKQCEVCGARSPVKQI